MGPEDFEHIVAAAAEVTGQNEFVVIGSQAILGSYDQPPNAMLQSLEVDIYPFARSGRRRLDRRRARGRVAVPSGVRLLRARRWARDGESAAGLAGAPGQARDPASPSVEAHRGRLVP